MSRQPRVDPVLVLRWEAPLDGLGPTPREVAAHVAARASEARIVLLDLTRTPCADGDGLGWLLLLRDALQASGRQLRVAARPGGTLWHDLGCLRAELEIYGSVGMAGKASESWCAGAKKRR